MYETHVFRQARQRDDETLNHFHTRLHHLAKGCDFTDAKKEIKTQLVEICKSTRVRRKALREDISLEDLLKYAGRTLETSDRQIATMEHTQQDVVVNKVYSGKLSQSVIKIITVNQNTKQNNFF